MPMTFEPLPLPTLRGQIAERIREAILNGQLRAGERIVERKLAAQFRASLTAIREAVFSLEAEGLISKKPNASTCVTKLTLADVDAIFEVRKLLEPYVVGKAATNASEQQTAALEHGYLELVDAARQNNIQLYVMRDFAWHSSVWSVGGNEYLQATLKRVTLPLFGFSSIRFKQRPAFDLLNDATSHAVLLESIKGRNAATAEQAMRSAIDFWYAEIREFFANQSEE